MLETLPSRDYDHLRKIEAEKLQKIVLSEQLTGTIIQAHTVSGNCYLFEVTDPARNLAHVVRCDSRPKAKDTGYLGERKITPVLEVKEWICHGESNTSLVKSLSILVWGTPEALNAYMGLIRPAS